jgi:predicted nuclease of restriction endonuclease-like (RecB) superfamily
MSSNTVVKVKPKDLKEYKAFFKEIKEKILTSQVKAALAVNQELINLYWEIGSKIHLKQKDEGWGAKTVENLTKDLKSTFPEMKGHNILLLQKLETLQDRLWYAHKTIEHGWRRNVLLHWLDRGLHRREGKAITNFQTTLRSPKAI